MRLTATAWENHIDSTGLSNIGQILIKYWSNFSQILDRYASDIVWHQEMARWVVFVVKEIMSFVMAAMIAERIAIQGRRAGRQGSKPS